LPARSRGCVREDADVDTAVGFRRVGIRGRSRGGRDGLTCVPARSKGWSSRAWCAAGSPRRPSPVARRSARAWLLGWAPIDRGGAGL